MGFTLASKIRKAIWRDDAAALEALLAQRKSLDISGMNIHIDGYRPLMYAAYKGAEKTAQVLLAHGADPNWRPGPGAWTAMHYAAYYGRLEITAAMLEHGGDPNLRTQDEKNARDLAEGRNYKDVVTLLTPYMKNPLEVLQAALPKPSVVAVEEPPAERPAEKKPPADRWELLAGDTVAHVFAPGETGYQITEVFNFAARERIRIIRNLATQNDTIDTKTFDEMADAAGLVKALRALREQGGAAEAQSIRQDAARLDKPGPAARKSG